MTGRTSGVETQKEEEEEVEWKEEEKEEEEEVSPEKVCESVRFRCTQMQTHCSAQNIPNAQKHKYTCRQHVAAQGKCPRVTNA